MVDATQPLRRDTECLDSATTTSMHDNGTAFSFPVMAADEPALERYGELCRTAVFSPSQDPLWVRSWISNARPDCVLAFVERDRTPVFGLCLVAAKEGPFRVARAMAGKHANGNFFPVAAEFLDDKASPALFASLFAAIGKARPDLDLLVLERLSKAIGRTANPLLHLPHRESPDIALAVNLEGGFDAVLSRAGGRRKCKKHRSQMRKFERAGGYRHFHARTGAEVDALLAAFFEMKAGRFARMGIRDVFAAAEIRSFFRSLFRDALKEERPPFFLHGLEVGGKLRAVTGMSIAKDRLICEFGGIVEDELTAASPGDFLFFENIMEACEDGFRVFDFSVGDEYYKRLWCDTVIRQFDVLVPLTLKGHAASAAWNATARAKHLVKNNELTRRWAKKIRAALATTPDH